MGQVRRDLFCSPLGKQSLRRSLSISKPLLEIFTQRKKKTLRKIIVIIIIIIITTKDDSVLTKVRIELSMAVDQIFLRLT